jgi:hypothetical protein
MNTCLQGCWRSSASADGGDEHHLVRPVHLLFHVTPITAVLTLRSKSIVFTHLYHAIAPMRSLPRKRLLCIQNL